MRALLPMIVVFAAAFFSTEAALGQRADRSTKVASQLVELINAADYAGIQTKYNKWQKPRASVPVTSASCCTAQRRSFPA